MKERIKKFIKAKGITASELADTIGVQRSNVSHVLNGRNKPGSVFIEKLLKAYPDLNARWLLIGAEEMFAKPVIEPDLFSKQLNKSKEEPKAEYKDNQTSDKESESNIKNAEFEIFNTKGDIIKKVENVVIFFDNNTFKIYHPD